MAATPQNFFFETATPQFRSIGACYMLLGLSSVTRKGSLILVHAPSRVAIGLMLVKLLFKFN
jgi:hypothetical protein